MIDYNRQEPPMKGIVNSKGTCLTTLCCLYKYCIKINYFYSFQMSASKMNFAKSFKCNYVLPNYIPHAPAIQNLLESIFLRISDF